MRQERSIVDDWPGEENIINLAHKSEGLFIFAATACRFLREASRLRRLLDARLTMILSNKVAGSSPLSGLDQIYTDIIQSSMFEEGVLDEEKEILADLFKRVVGSIIVLFEPLSVKTVSGLTLVPIQDAEETLNCLHSVLAVPKDES
ncbi:hypothetical protein BDW74DRAFT_177344 [Aspergillus multicolor]|uniref:uncharacterized protein n=1 Tax=Aspergillus multicolor TaxID=41759 RepID=UPI003CCDE4B6